ncbi:MAG: hypothetical protein KDE56_33855, partial [Anaerolineales bacterium]|nr:hypothetical protein [Anaerolineales bacterium]
AVNAELVDYLQTNTQGMKYMMAVPSSQQGAQYVIDTGRPVLYMGGFSGGDAVVTADDLAQLVANGDLRYILFSGGDRNSQEISNWLANSCTVVDGFSVTQNGPQGQSGPGRGQQMKLYDCQ